MTPYTNGTTKTPAEVLHEKGLTIADIVRMTGLNINAARRAVMGGNHRIKDKTADLVAGALGMSRDDLSWPVELTNRGRTPLTGGKYTIGVSTDDDGGSCSIGQEDDTDQDELHAKRMRKHIMSEKFCSDPEHNLLLPLSGVCALCAA